MISPEALSLAISRCWPRIQAVLSDDDWKSFSGRLITPLRQLDDQTLDAAPIMRSIEALFSEYPAATAILAATTERTESESLEAARDRPSLGSPFKHEPSRQVLIDVLFGTDRQVTTVAGEVPKFGGLTSNRLSFGSATVSLPDDRRKGTLERPRWYRLEFRENPGKHVMITSLASLTEDELCSTLAS